MLAAAEKAGNRVRARVRYTAGQMGWILLVISLTPTFLWGFSYPWDLSAATGRWEYWIVFFPWGVALLGLALRPTDADAIHGVCVTFLVVLLAVGRQRVPTAVPRSPHGAQCPHSAH